MPQATLLVEEIAQNFKRRRQAAVWSCVELREQREILREFNRVAFAWRALGLARRNIILDYARTVSITDQVCYVSTMMVLLCSFLIDVRLRF